VTFINTSTNADQFDWEFGDGAFSSLEQPSNMYDSTGTYTVVLIASNGCGTDTVTQDVTMIAQASLTLSGPDALCEGEEALYTIALDGANILSSQWSTGDVNSDSVLFSTSFNIAISVDVTGDNGCTYNDAIDVLISPPPTANFTYATEDCGNQVQFTDASTGALSWSWEFDNSSGSAVPSPLAEYEVAGTFVVVLVVSNACGSDTIAQELTLGPTGSISINGPSMLCADSIGIFSVWLNGADITSVDWSNGGDVATTQFSTTDNADLIVSVSDDEGCTYADTIAISVLSGPQAGFTTAQDPCDSVVQFIDASLNALTWQWDLGNGQTSALADPEATYPTPGMYITTLIVGGECGTDTASQNIGIGAIGTINLQGPATICDNEELAYSVALVGGSVSHVQWSTGDTTTTILLQISGNQLLTATVIGDDGCSYEAELAINVIGVDGEAANYVPNVFTPNGDGLNETFAPVLSEPDGFRELLIFNRWGQEIYATSSLAQPWNGRLDGEPVPDGTYVYIVRWKDLCTGVKKEEHGHVTLLH
jgi:gliding motility-associated-like protein